MKSQNGFRENSITEDAILDFMNYADDSIHNSECLFVVYVDLPKAFDTVNHNKTLESCSILGHEGEFLLVQDLSLEP